MWQFCGYNEIQNPPRRYRILDLAGLARLMGFTELIDMQAAHKKWVEASLRMDVPERESHWTESIASGSRSFIEDVKRALDSKPKVSPLQAVRIIISLEKISPLLATLQFIALNLVKAQILMGTIHLVGGKFLKRLIFISK